MTQPFDWTPEADHTLIQMRAEKKPFSAIAEALNCTPGAAEQRSYVLRKAGVKIWVRMEEQIATPEQLAELRRLMADEMTRKEAAASISVSDWKAERWLATPRRKKGAPLSPTEPDQEAEPRKSWWGMPAGDPVSWGAITAGTVLDGVGYPAP